MRAIFFTGYGLAIKPVVKQNDIILVLVFILLYGLDKEVKSIWVMSVVEEMV